MNKDGRREIDFVRNLLTKVPKAAHGLVATFVRTIFAQPDVASVRAQHARTVERLQLQPRFTDAARMLAEAEELLAFTAFPKEHWRQIWSNNPQERLNRIRRDGALRRCSSRAAGALESTCAPARSARRPM